MLFLLDCIGFMMPAVRDKTQRRKDAAWLGAVSAAEQANQLYNVRYKPVKFQGNLRLQMLCTNH